MEIKVAEHCGFCYGVKRAVALAKKAATDRVQGYLPFTRRGA